ncbi:MAG TPA: hypothetical protein DCY91_27420 [Cyanobacteria bacterium UBA11370]|nr:hypothetical protein [Cyanobacteria bacterium UBA11370]HBY80363.1 hypothetical protein [Cyanobacteria bacterium UBA11148]
MKPLFLSSSSLLVLGLMAGCQNSQVGSEPSTSQKEPQVIELTQTGCQFLETEDKDYQFTTKSGEDCKKINSQTLSDRKTGFKPLNLKAGDYIFRVTNRNVPYELGFYLRGEGSNQLTLPKVSGGGLTEGKTQDYPITLRPGNYVFSCPLNPTPDYPLVVQ